MSGIQLYMERFWKYC